MSDEWHVFNHEQQCYGKRGYSRKDWAKQARVSMERRQGARLKVYSCPHCGRWHLGNDISRKMKRIKREPLTATVESQP